MRSRPIRGRLIAALSEIRAPILYLRASNDRLVPDALGEEAFRANSSVKVFDLAGPHFLLQAQPREAAKVVADFARKCLP